MTSYRRAASFVSISVRAAGLVLVTGCAVAPDPESESSGASALVETNFIKDGNNGTVSCDTYCAGAQWPGGVGTCQRAVDYAVSCDQATGFLTNGSELTCQCATEGGTFAKHGNNGTVSCDTFCAGAQWGDVGTCWEAGAYNYPCSAAPGYFNNGQELQCICGDCRIRRASEIPVPVPPGRGPMDASDPSCPFSCMSHGSKLGRTGPSGS